MFHIDPQSFLFPSGQAHVSQQIHLTFYVWCVQLQRQMTDEKFGKTITVSDLADQPQRSGAHSTRASMMPLETPVCWADPLAGIKTTAGEQSPTLHKHLFHRQIYGRQLLLSVDDDPINQMVVSNLLQPMGCRVQQAMNGHEALAALEQATTLPDLVLLDCMMPGMSGYSVCQYMRSRYGMSFAYQVRLSDSVSRCRTHWAALACVAILRSCTTAFLPNSVGENKWYNSTSSVMLRCGTVFLSTLKYIFSIQAELINVCEHCMCE